LELHVYKGKLHNNTMVAIDELRISERQEQCFEQNEISISSQAPKPCEASGLLLEEQGCSAGILVHSKQCT
jgi:hypothetical protein